MRQRTAKVELSRWLSRRDAKRIARVCARRRFPRGDSFSITVLHLGVDLPLRARTADALDVYDSLVIRSHLPPNDLRPGTIVDAGLCTGITLYDFAELYPAARIVGIEPQPYYAQLCRRISERYGDRVEVVEACLNRDDVGDVPLYVQEGEEYAASMNAFPAGNELRVRTISLNTLVEELGSIDFLKLDIEGAEREILRRNVAWADRTRCIKVELHGDYTISECTADLERLGFDCRPDPRHWACVLGRRDQAACREHRPDAPRGSRAVNVLVLMPLAEQRGGQEAMLIELLKNRSPGDIAWMVVFFEDGPMVAEARSLGVEATVLRAGRLRQASRYLRTVAAVARLASTADVVLSWMAKAHLYGGPAAAIARKPAIWFQPGMPSSRVWMDRAVTLLPAAGVVTVSTATDAAQRAIRPVRRTALVRPGVDLSRFDPAAVPALGQARASLGLDPDVRIVGVIARLQHWKGIHLLIEALPQIRALFPDTIALIVGGTHFAEPDYENRLRHLAKELGVEKDVVFAGFQRNVPLWLSAMNVVAHPADNEPFGLAVVEAMALGKPVVASDSGGPLEIIEDGRSGLLFRTGDARELAAGVCRVLDDDELGRQIGEGARGRAQLFSSGRFAERIAEAVRAFVAAA